MFNKIDKLAHHDGFIDVLWLILLMSIGYFWRLGNYPLFTPDEGRYTEVAREMLASGHYLIPTLNGVIFLDKPILHYWLQMFSIKCFGLNEWAARFFPTSFAIFGAISTYCSGRLLFNRHTAILATLMLATSPLYFISAHYANLDLETAVLISNALLCFILSTKTQSNQLYWLFCAYGFSALAFLMKGLIAIVFPMLIGFTWMMWQGYFVPFKKYSLLIGISLFLSISLPWYYRVAQANPHFFYSFFIHEQFSRFFSIQTFNNVAPFWFYIPVILMGGFPWSILNLYALWFIFTLGAVEKQNNKPTLLFLLLWVSLILIFFSIPQSKIMTYILPVFPALALLTSHIICTHTHLLQYSNLNRIHSVLFVLWIFILLKMINGINLTSLHLGPPLLSKILYLSVISLGLGWIGLKKKCLAIFLLTYVILISLILGMLVYNASDFNVSSTKKLALSLKSMMKATDHVMTYLNYYYDLPIYLQQYIPIVFNTREIDIIHKDGWQRDLYHPALSSKFSPWMGLIPFKQEWQAKNRVFVFLKQDDMLSLRKLIAHYYFIGKERETLLLSNQPNLKNKK